MMNGNQEEVVEQNQTTEESLEPVDIAEAFKLVREMDKKPAGNNVAATETTEQQPQQQQEQYTEQPGEANNTEQSGEYTEGGGSSVSYSDIDYDTPAQELMKQINYLANLNTKKYLDEKKYQHVSVQELVERDERTGNIEFINPDRSSGDRKTYFSSRSEAQSWVDTINKQIDSEATNYAKKEQQRLIQENAPIFNLYRFAPTLDSMSELEINFLDDIIEPYGVTNGRGEVVGYNCNLNQAAAQARKMANNFMQRYGKQEQQPESNENQSKQASGPALDAKSHGTQNGSLGASNYDDITDLSQALRLVQKQEREKKNGK